MEEENDQDIINDVARVMGVLGDKIERLVDPLDTATSERSNGPSSITKNPGLNFTSPLSSNKRKKIP